MASLDITKSLKIPSSFSALSSLGKGRIGLVSGGSGGLFLSADDHRLSQQVQEKHSPDGRQVDVRPLLQLVEDIFARANLTLTTESEGKTKGGVEANGGLEVSGGASVGSGVSLGTEAQAGAGIGGGLGAKLNIGGGIGVSVGGSIGVGAGAEAGAVLEGGLGGSLGLGGAIGAKVGIDGGFDVKGDAAATFDISPDLPLMIERVSCEMGCKCLAGTDAHVATLSVLDTLAHYSWEAKMVITLAAFAANYGEFLLLTQVYSSNPLAQAMALLKQLPFIFHQGDDKLKRQIDAIKSLINAMLNVTKLVVDFSELPSEYIKPDEPSIKTVQSHFPLVAYWTIRSSVAAAAQIALVATMGHEFTSSTTEFDLLSWSGKLKVVFDFLVKMKVSVQRVIAEKIEEEAYTKIRKIVFKTVHQDNMTVLRTLIYSKDDALPLFDGSTKKRVQLDVLQGKMVLLLVTGLEISQDELTILENIYNESKTHPYSIVWMPMVDRSITWSDSLQSQFEQTQSTMPWYSVYHPSIVGSAVIRFFSKDLSFKGKPILVPIDTQGRITSTNALHMMWIWKNDAFPFTSTREESLWANETWRLELLVDSIHPSIANWAKEDKYVFLYGGEDIEWIRKFTKLAKDVALTANINLELLYVGKSCKKETVRKITSTIETEKLSDYLKDVTDTWFFWTRLDGMLHSLVQLDRVNDHTNKVIQEIKKLVSYDKNSGGWAVLAKGPNLEVSVHGTTIVDLLIKFDSWRARVVELGLSAALAYMIQAEGPEHTCFRFEFPTSTGKIPHEMKCPDCNNHMQNYITFVCCHEGVVGGGAKQEPAH